MALVFLFFIIIFLYYWIPVIRYKKTDYYKQTHQSFQSVSSNKGTNGEFQIWKSLSNLNGYQKWLFNCYLPKDDGETTEADLILLHESGIYVFESKNYSGWIFGAEDQEYWTQTLPDGRGKSKKNRFFNPLIQNKVHIHWLARYLTIDPDTIYSYIVFSDHCVLQNVTLPSGRHYVLNLRNLVPSINYNFWHPVKPLTVQEIDRFYEMLYPLTQSTQAQRLAHVEEVRRKKEPPSAPSSVVSLHERCPRCGGKLVLRVASKGPNAGKKFWGCSNFPRCRYTKDAEND